MDDFARTLGRGVRLRFLILALGVASLSSTATAVVVQHEDEVWITLGADAFEAASMVFPRGANGESLPRVAELEGVVLTRVSSSGLDAVAEVIHEQFHRCGGYVLHESQADGEAELARLQVANRQPLGGLPFVIDQPDWVAALAGSVEESQILATITSLSTDFPNRYHAHPSGTNAAHWIRDLWAGYAAERPDVTVELISHASAPAPQQTNQPSVRLTIPGTSKASEVVVLGGHLDSTASGNSVPTFSAPGADDDASGIATLSEVIRVALASGFQPQRTVQFFAYAAEEVGLRGSTHIASQYFAAGTNVVAVLQQDMTGFKGSAQDIWLISDNTNAALNAFLGELIDTYQPSLLWSTTACGYACSDHAPWHSRGFPATFAFEAKFGQYNTNIHKASDTVSNLTNGAAHAIKFARLAVAFLVETGLGPLIFGDGFESGDTSAWVEGGEP